MNWGSGMGSGSCEVPDAPQIAGMREMKKEDVGRVHRLVANYLKRLGLQKPRREELALMADSDPAGVDVERSLANSVRGTKPPG